MAKRSFTKGWAFERKVAKIFRAWGGEGFERSAGSGNSPRTSAIADLNRPTWFRFAIECKDSESWNWSQVVRGMGEWPQWWAKLQDQAPEGWLVFTRNREPIYVAVPWMASAEIRHDHAITPLAALMAPECDVFLLETLLAAVDPEWFKTQPEGRWHDCIPF